MLLALGCIQLSPSLNLGCCDPAGGGSAEECDDWSDFKVEGQPITAIPSYSDFVTSATFTADCSEGECLVTARYQGEEVELTVPLCGGEELCGVGCSFIACEPYTAKPPFGGGDVGEVMDYLNSICDGDVECMRARFPSLFPSTLVYTPQGYLYSACGVVRASTPSQVSSLSQKPLASFFLGIGRDLVESTYADYLPSTDFLCAINPVGRKDRFVNYYVPSLFPPSADDEVPYLFAPLPLSGSSGQCSLEPSTHLYYFTEGGRRVYFPSLFQCEKAAREGLQHPYLSSMPPVLPNQEAYALGYPAGGLLMREGYAQGRAVLPGWSEEVVREEVEVPDAPFSAVSRTVLRAEAPYVYLVGSTPPVLIDEIEGALSAWEDGNISFYVVEPNSVGASSSLRLCASAKGENLTSCLEGGDCPEGFSLIPSTSTDPVSYLQLACGILYLIPYEAALSDGEPVSLTSALEAALEEGEGFVFFPSTGPGITCPSGSLSCTLDPWAVSFYTKDELDSINQGAFSFYLMPTTFSLSRAMPYLFASLYSSSTVPFTASGSVNSLESGIVEYSATLYAQQPLYFYGEKTYAFDYECSSPDECLSGRCSFSTYSRVVVPLGDGTAVANSHCFSDGYSLRCPPHAQWRAPSPSGESDVVFPTVEERAVIPVLKAEWYSESKATSRLGGSEEENAWTLTVWREPISPYGRIKAVSTERGDLKVALFVPPNALPEEIEGLRVRFPLTWYSDTYGWNPSGGALPVANIWDKTNDNGFYQRGGPVLRALISFNPNERTVYPDENGQLVKLPIGEEHWGDVCDPDEDGEVNGDEEFADLNGPWDDGGDPGRWDKGYPFDGWTDVVHTWCSGHTCYAGSAKGVDHKCDRTGGSFTPFFTWPVDIDLYKYLTMTWQEGDEEKNANYNLGNFSLFPVCGLEEEFVLCANPLFRSPTTTEIVMRKKVLCDSDSRDCNVVEYQPPLSYTPLEKEISLPGGEELTAYFIRGGVPSAGDAQLEEAKMLVLAYNGIGEEDAARICSSLTLDDFCLSGTCLLDKDYSTGTFAPTLLVVGDFNGDGYVGKNCIADNNTVIAFHAYGWCEGCSGFNSRALYINESIQHQPPTVSGIYNESHVVGINRPVQGEYGDRVDSAVLPPIYYDVESLSPIFPLYRYEEREDLSWPALSPPQGVLKDHMRDWMRRGITVILFPTQELLESEQLPLLLRDIAGFDADPSSMGDERKDVPIGMVVVVLSEGDIFSNTQNTLAQKVKEVCPTCWVALQITPSEVADLPSKVGLSGDGTCARRDIVGQTCSLPMDAVLLRVRPSVDPCSSPEDYQPIFDGWMANASFIAEKLGLPTIIYVEELSSTVPVSQDYTVSCGGEGRRPFTTFFLTLSANKKALINSGVWGIHFEDLSKADPGSSFSLYEGDYPSTVREGAVEDFNLLFRTAVAQPVMRPSPAEVGNCTTCIPREACINRKWGEEVVNPSGKPLSALYVKCSDGWEGLAEELLSSTSPTAQYRLASITFYTGLSLCGDKAYTLTPILSQSPSLFAFCETGDRPCHEEGVDLQQFLEAVVGMSDVVCWVEYEKNWDETNPR